MADTVPTPSTPSPAPRSSGGTRSRLGKLRKAGGKAAVPALALGALTGLVMRGLRTPSSTAELDEAVNNAVRRAKGEKLGRLLEQARMERALAQNQARLAQANPTLYTSVMAGRKVPTGAVVLGGRPRTDLMRELAASMDSGAFQKKDPLSELMG